MLPRRTRLYRNAVFDSGRWDAFSARPGDVVVCVPPKCGTTWTARLVAMVIEGSAALSQPLGRLIPWLDATVTPIDELTADLDARTGPRILKTHTPLDGLPYDPTLRYVFCGRDPRDAFLSMLDHVANSADSRQSGVAPGTALDPNVLFPRWATQGQFPWMADGAPFQSVVSFTETYWRFRRLPNLLMLHYRDLTLDLPGELDRLAAFLGVELSVQLRAEILAAAGFETMKTDADLNAPGAERGAWLSNSDFFRAARLDQWREVLSPQNQALYERVNAARLDPALKAWMEGGRRAIAP